MISKNSIKKLWVVFFILMFVISGCRSVDGNDTEEKDGVDKINVSTDIKKQYHVYTIEEKPEQTLESIRVGLKKEEKEGKTEQISKDCNIWSYENDKTGESITAVIDKKKNQLYSFFYRASLQREYIYNTMSAARADAWDLVSSSNLSNTDESLEFLPIKKAIQEVQSFLNSIGFHDIGIYRYSIMNRDKIEKLEQENEKDEEEQEYYYMVFTPQIDGVSYFTSERGDYRRPDFVIQSMIVPEIECFYDEDGIYLAMTQCGFYTIKSDLGTVDVISYEEALEKAKISMNYMEGASELQGQAEYQWNSAGIEYLPYYEEENHEIFQLLPVWVFHGKKKSSDTISEAYIIIDAQTGESLSESL